jgi:hypothetical protein
VAEALVGDVADVVRIDTLRSAPLIVEGSTKVSRAIDRRLAFGRRRVESSPRELLPKLAHFCRPLSRSALLSFALAARKISCKERVDLRVRHETAQSGEAAF